MSLELTLVTGLLVCQLTVLRAEVQSAVPASLGNVSLRASDLAAWRDVSMHCTVWGRCGHSQEGENGCWNAPHLASKSDAGIPEIAVGLSDIVIMAAVEILREKNRIPT